MTEELTTVGVHLISAGIYVMYFLIYYGRYSTLNQKLNGILKIEKAGIVDQSIIDTSKANTNRKISAWRKRCYLPLPFIALAHFIELYSVFPHCFLSEYLVIIYVGLGGAGLIWIGNYTKGAQIFDPDKRFWGGSNNY